MDKFCVDCKHVGLAYRDRRHNCLRNVCEGIDLVTGEMRPEGRPLACSDERYSVGEKHCGKSGRFFEPKDS